MDFRIRNVALLFLALVLAAGLASAQPGVTVKQVGSNGAVTQTNVNFSGSNGGPVPKAPTGGANGTYKYWDVLGTGGTSTNYFSTPPYITAPPNPQVAVGPDDIFTIVNRTIAHFPNINAGTGGNNAVGVANPYNNPPTEYVWLDVWLGIPALATLCPLQANPNAYDAANCVIDNASVRYDQMQGRYVVLYTVTDVAADRSNFVLIVSNTAQFNKCANTPASCPGGSSSSPLFTPPVIAPIVGGTQTGGQNTANWTAYFIPVNLLYSVTQPTALGNGIVGAPATVTTGGQVLATGAAGVTSNAPGGSFVVANFCANGGPALPLTGGPGGTMRTCTNYFPTSARFGLDNDNIILIAPVLDEAFSPAEGSLPTGPGQQFGPYAGTRVVTIAKDIVYNAGSLNLSTQPPSCDGDNPIDCTAINLSDDVVTGTLTEVAGCTVKAPVLGTCESTGGANPIPGIYWEPDNLRGRALASFDAQVAPYGFFNPPAMSVAGVITPVDYLVGRLTAAIGDIPPGSPADFTIYVQPVVFSCPAGALFPGLASVSFCGMPSGSAVADQSFLGPLLANTSSIALAWNPQTVGQGYSAAAMTSNPLVTPVSPEVNNRLYVGDARPVQVMFREGLLYEARSVQLFDSSLNALGTSTVLYDVVRTCATGAPNPTCGYSANGAALLATPPFLALEAEWTNGQNVSDPADDIPGFGFYAPMFESPADVVNSGPTSPIALESWLEKLFVGMTTGGTSNLSATFNVDFPSLWDFRPGDDAYDSVGPFLDPYTGVVQETVPCPNSLVVIGTVTAKSATVAVTSTVGLYVGMFVSATPNSSGNLPLALTPPSQGAGTVTANPTVPNPTTITAIVGNTITLSNPVTFPAADTGTTAVVSIAFAKTQNTVNVTVNATSTNLTPLTSQTVAGGGLINGVNELVISAGVPSVVQIGSTVAGRTITDTSYPEAGLVCASAPAPNECAGVSGVGGLVVSNFTNVGPGMTVGTTAVATISGISITSGSATIATPAPSPTGGAIFVGDLVTGTGIPAGTTVTAVNAAGTVVTLSAAATASSASASLVFSSGGGSILPAGTIVISTITVGPIQEIALSNVLAADVAMGRNVTFSSTALIPAGTTVTNIGSNGVVFLSNNIVLPAGILSTCPTAPAGTTTIPFPAGPIVCTNNIPVIFGAAAQGFACPLIRWSHRGGASTDPNDGSLWLFGEFAKYRLSTIQSGPGQWGTSIANYALDFPASDPYNNDNTYFTDVPSTNGFFTWIQIAKNLNIAQPAGVVTAGSTGITNGGVPACSTNGNPPVQPPPPPGSTTSPGTSTLLCAQFNPTGQVTRAEMAYWVVRAQMDENMVSNFLCATGGDPTGIAPCAVGGAGSFTFGDTNLANNPFVQTNLPSGFTVVTTPMIERYIEVMARRGYTKGAGVCTAPGTDDAVYRFCPNDLVTRAEMAVFIIRAKMNNVFPTSLSGIPTASPYGDQFKYFLPAGQYFSDVPNSGGTADYYIYIQKMRELRITNGTTGTTFSPNNPLMREEIATFVVRAFFL